MSYRFVLAAFLVLAIAVSVASQDVLYYKFEAGGGKKVSNYAGHTGIAPLEAPILHSSRYPNCTLWTQGQYGTALMGDPMGLETRIKMDTGWDCGFTGSFTVATFLKMRTPLPTHSGASILRNYNSSSSGSCIIQGHMSGK